MSETLTASRINELLAQTKERGAHERFLRQFATSGEMYAVVTDNIKYAGKTYDQLKALKNQFQTLATKHGLNLRCVFNDESLLVVNLDAVAADAAE